MLYLLRRPDQHPDWLCLFKASDEPGTRWITVHPNGRDEEGHAVLIRESQSSPGTWHVIGGAEGKLNHMTLDHIGSKADWAQKAKDRKAADKAAGKEATPETKAATKEAKKKAKIKFVNAVADQLGWDKNWYKTAEDYIREQPALKTNAMAAGILADRNLNEHVKKAREEVARYERRLRADSEARSQAGLGDLSLSNDPFRATETDMSDVHIQDKILQHADAAVTAEAEEQVERAEEAKLYEGLASTLTTMPDDASSTEIGDVVDRIGQPNTAEARAILSKLRTQDVTPSDAAKTLQQTAAAVRSGKEDLLGGGRAKHHQEVKDLYAQAQSALANGDEQAAQRYVEQAKRATGDYNIDALDLVGAKAKEGKGYKPVERERARADIAARGEDTPEAIGQRLEEATDLYNQYGRDPSGGGAELQYGVNEQVKALQRAHDAAAKGDLTAAQDHILEADKFVVYTGDLADKLHDSSSEDGSPNIEKAQAAIAARQKILAAHAAVRAVKSTGGGAGSGGGGRSGGGGSGGGRAGGGKVSDETLDMSKAVGLLKAKGALREREKQLDQAKRDANIDPDAFKTALKDERVDETAISDEDVQKIGDRIRQLSQSKTHSDLIGMVENPGVFQAAAGEDQVRAGSIAKWVDMGRDAAMNLIGQVAGDGVELDRAKFSALGIKDASALLAQHIANTTTDARREEILAGLEHYHSGRAFNVASEAMRAAEACIEQAKEFEMKGKVSAYDLSEMNHYNKLRMECVDQALATVGSAYGELNATAEMIWALGGARKAADNGYTIKGGTRDRGGLVVLARSLGLEPHEFNVNSPKYDPDTKESRPGSVSLSPEGSKKLFRQKGMGEQKKEAALQAIKADPGEPDYLPRGIARRPASTFDDPEKRPDQYAQPPAWKGVDFSTPEGEEKLADYMGERLADGMSPEQLYSEMHSPRLMSPHLQPGKQFDQYRAALTRAFPQTFDENWKNDAEAWAQDVVARRTGGTGDTLNSQTIRERDPQTIEAAHRALAKNPYGIYAFHEVGDLGAGGMAKVRDYAYKHLWHLDGDKPTDKDAQQAPSPSSDNWGNIEGNTLPQGVPQDPQGKHWQDFADRMGGAQAAYTAVLHHIRGDAMRQFAESYGQVTGQALRTGTAAIPGGGKFYQHHADKATQQRIDDAVSQGIDSEKNRGAISRQIARDQPQAAMPDRTTIGTTAENRLKSVWGNVSDAFHPDKPIDLLKTKDLSMNGRYVNQQRAVKAILSNERVVMALGVGSGKSVISMGAFTEAHHDGKASHGLWSVPQNMIGQFGSEAATYLDPAANGGKGYKWFAKPGASAEERQSKMASQDHHMVFTTHESLRDDVVHAIADHKGLDRAHVEKFMRGEIGLDGAKRDDKTRDVDAEREERAQAVKAAFDHKGWGHRLQYFCVDEGHKALNRQGKVDSLMAHALDGISDNSRHYVPMTGTPIKNDLSEAYDWLSKMDRKKFPESGRADWMRNNAGVGHVSARIRELRQGAAGTPGDPKDWTNAALAEVYQRALAPHMFQTRVPLNQPLTRRKEEVTLSGEHEKAFNGVTEAYANARKAHAQGGYDHDALRTLSPNSYAGQPESAHPAIAAKLHKALHITLRGAYNRVLHARPEQNDKLDRLSSLVHEYRKADSYHTKADGKPHKGKPVIVFAHNLDSVETMRKRLTADGHRVGVITGEHSAAEKERVKAGFQPPNYKTNLSRGQPDADADYDVLVNSDAVSAGADLPRAEAVVHYDIPDTAATHEQRTARAHRLSSEHPVEMTDIVSKTPYEQKNWMRLQNKYALSDVSQNPSEKMDDTGIQHSMVIGQQIAVAKREAKRRKGQQQPAAAQQQATGTEGGGAPAPQQAPQDAGEPSPLRRLSRGPEHDLESARKLFTNPAEPISISRIQRELQVGYNRAADIEATLTAERAQKP